MVYRMELFLENAVVAGEHVCHDGVVCIYMPVPAFIWQRALKEMKSNEES